MGGGGFSIFPTELLEATGADWGVAGPGEETLPHLLAALAAGRDPGPPPGLVRRAPGGGIRRVPAAPIGQPWIAPRHDHAVLAAYQRAGSMPGVQTQRGCPLRCVYCTYPLLEGRRSRFRPAGEVVAEMRSLAEQGIDPVFLVDSVLNTRAAHVAGLCRALIEARQGVTWECFLRPAQVTTELMHLMREAGLTHVEFGTDSLAGATLAANGKGFAPADVLAAHAAARSAGVHAAHFLIFGGPAETPATVEETIARADQLEGALIFATIGMRVYPGSPLAREWARRGRPPPRLDPPEFFLEDGCAVEGLAARLGEVARRRTNWVRGDLPPAFTGAARRLRERGVRGSLWEYLEPMRRLAAAQSG